MFDFTLDDLFDDDTFAIAAATQQKNGRGALKTTASQGDPSRTLTTFSLSEVLQGYGVYKPSGMTYDQYNQVLTASLASVNSEEGGLAAALPGTRIDLIPYDALRTTGFSSPQVLAGGSGPGPIGDIAVAGAPSQAAATAVQAALAQVGDPYTWGAHPSSTDADPSTFDCSGLCIWAYGRAGVSMGGDAGTLFAGQGSGALLPPVREAFVPGDLVFYWGDRRGQGSADHVAMALGNGQIVHARNSAMGVRTDDINYWQTHLVGGRRPTSGASITPPIGGTGGPV